MSQIDPKVRAIYHLMLNERIFVFDPFTNQRVVWTWDEEAAKEIIRCSTETDSALQIARQLAFELRK